MADEAAGVIGVGCELGCGVMRRIKIFLSRFGLCKSPEWVFVQGETEVGISQSVAEGDFYKEKVQWGDKVLWGHFPKDTDGGLVFIEEEAQDD